MPAITATAPGKTILFGEHAVVYGRPAIAAPVNQVRAWAIVSANPRGASGEVLVQAPGVGLEAYMDELAEDQPIGQAIRGTLAALGVKRLPACTVRINSTIPVAAGLGSGAAVSVAIIRAVANFAGRPLPDETVSALAYQVDQLYHGTPSGIDNTVITYARPVYFVRGQPIQMLKLPAPFTIVIGDTGVQSPTSAVVGEVRNAWQAESERFERLFDDVGRIARAARQAIEAGRPQELGGLMDENHALLYDMGVSSAELEQLVWAARVAGAQGAKLCGGGRGGNMIALVDETQAQAVAQKLVQNGAVRTIITTIQSPDHPIVRRG
jgi:mevalonate kinase